MVLVYYVINMCTAQGYIGLAEDMGQPVLLPPGMHQWNSSTLSFKSNGAVSSVTLVPQHGMIVIAMAGVWSECVVLCS